MKSLGPASALVLLILALKVSAHQFDPLLLHIRQVEGARYQVIGRTPIVSDQEAPTFPEHCTEVTPLSVQTTGSYRVYRILLNCPSPGLMGQPFTFPTGKGKDVMLSLAFADGKVQRMVLRPEGKGYVLPIPSETGFMSVFQRYAKVGFFHILTGWDHLLFILALVMLVTGFRKLVLTITAFTLGHSITLSLAALGWLKLPSAPVEACIAASIVLLAAEAIRTQKMGMGKINADSKSGRPWFLALVFGLVHGLGFAGALIERGLPSGEVPAALLAFNGGVEVGQILFVSIVLLIFAGLRGLPIWLRTANASPFLSYAIGSTGAFWFCQRFIALFQIN